MVTCWRHQEWPMSYCNLLPSKKVSEIVLQVWVFVYMKVSYSMWGWIWHTYIDFIGLQRCGNLVVSTIFVKHGWFVKLLKIFFPCNVITLYHQGTELRGYVSNLYEILPLGVYSRIWFKLLLLLLFNLTMSWVRDSNLNVFLYFHFTQFCIIFSIWWRMTSENEKHSEEVGYLILFSFLFIPNYYFCCDISY